MQGTPPWYTPPSSALHHEPNNSNYFYNYNQWNRPSGNYDTRSYPHQPQMSNMRSGSDCFGSPHQGGHLQNTYDHHQMFYRPGTGGGEYEDGSGHRARGDRARPTTSSSTNGSSAVAADTPQAIYNKPKNFNANAKSNESDAENFSFVFTQSLTSLYSNDGETNFTEDSDRTGSTIPCAKIKTEDISNDCTQEYSYGNSFEPPVPNNSSVVNFENVKIKTEPYTKDNMPSYAGYPLSNMFMRRRRGTLAEAYSRKRKLSAPAGTFAKPMNLEGTEDKSQRMFQSESQWIPNSISTCEASDGSTYQQPEYEDKLSGFDGGRFGKRHPMKSRTGRARGEPGEAKPASGCKKIQKKISPLTLYAKVVDDRIVDVTCRRYKKRSKPKNNNEPVVEPPVEETVSTTNGSEPPVTKKESWNDIFEAVSELLKELVEKVAEKHEREIRNRAELCGLDPQRAQQLMYKFCRDFNLDYRDFINADEIIKFDVTKQDTHHRKKRLDRSRSVSITEENLKKRRGRSSEKEESVDRKPEKAKEKIPDPEPKKEIPEEKPEKPKPKPEKEKPKPKAKALRSSRQSSRQREQDASPPPARVLRSLPSRQPQPPARKTRSSKKAAPRSRYPKRNLRSKKNNNTTNTKGNKKLKILIELSKENEQTEVLEVESDNSSHEPNFVADRDSNRKSESESEDEDEKKKGTKEKEKSETRKPEPVVTQDDESTSITIVDQAVDPKEAIDVTDCIKKEIDGDCEKDEDFVSRQPPQLVRMTDEFDIPQDSEEKQEETVINERSIEEDVEPSGKSTLVQSDTKTCEPVADNPPPTLQPNENFSPDLNTDNVPPLNLEYDQRLPNGNDDPVAKTTGSNMDIATPTSLYMPSTLTHNGESVASESNSSDDCIVVVHKTGNMNREQVKPDVSTKSLLKEKLLGKSHADNTDGTQGGENKNHYYPSSSKGFGKEEQDESILRTLLLETDGVPNSGIVKERESSRTCSPFVPGANGMNVLSPEIIKMLERESFDTMCSFYNESLNDKQLSQIIMQYPLSYHEAFFSLLSPEECEQYFSSDPNLCSKDKGDSKNDVYLKRSMGLSKVIQKLKEEITYLFDLVSQKDKERLAILCFVRQKEQLVEHLKKVSIRIMQQNDYPQTTYVPLKKEITDDQTDAATTSAIDMGQNLSLARSATSYTMYDPNSSIIQNGFIDGAHSSSVNHRPQSIHTPQKVPAVKPSPVATPPEKVSTVATMVAKATENYGLDMSNLRERLRCSPETSTSGNLLQKALSSQSPNSTPASPYRAPSWPVDKNPNVRSSMTMVKSGTQVSAKSYQYNVPLDMVTSRVSPNVDIRPSQIPEAHRHNIAVPTPIRTVSDQSQIESLLAEPVQMKSHCNTYRSCSMQSGGHYGESRPGFTRPVPNMPRIMPSLGLAAPIPMPSSSSSSSTTSSPDVGENSSERQHKGRPSQNLGMNPVPMKPNYYMGNHRSLNLSNKMGGRPPSSATATCSRPKKAEESGCPLNYATSSTSSNGIPPSIQINSSACSTISSSAASATATGDYNADNVTLPHCMNCGVIRPRFVCSGCRQHMYCSTRCQTARWPDHSSDCNASVERSDASTSYS